MQTCKLSEKSCWSPPIALGLFKEPTRDNPHQSVTSGKHTASLKMSIGVRWHSCSLIESSC
jgi:hypothetical protein